MQLSFYGKYLKHQSELESESNHFSHFLKELDLRSLRTRTLSEFAAFQKMG